MIATLTLNNGKGEAVALHQVAGTGQRALISAKGLVGIGPLRESKRVRPQAHGSLNETKFEEGRTIVLEGEIVGSSMANCEEEASACFRPMLETLDVAPALLKWETQGGRKLQMLVKLDSDIEPVMTGVAPRLVYQVSFLAEDPRAYTQTQKTETGGTITGTAAENEWLKSNPRRGLAIDATYVYWSEHLAIGRAKLGGTGVEKEWIKGIPTPLAMAVSAEYMYWTGKGGISRCKLSTPGSPEENWLNDLSVFPGDPGGSQSEALALDGSHLYWGWYKGIGRSAIGGTAIEPEWIPVSPGTSIPALAVSSEYIYYGYGTTALGRATIAGASQNNSFITGLSYPRGVAVRSPYLYWTNETGNAVGRALLAGTEVNESFYVGLKVPGAIAVNSEQIYWNNKTIGYIGRSNNLSGSISGSAITVAQSGNRPTPLIFKVHGSIENASIVRESDGSRLALNGTITSGNYVEIDTAQRTVKLNGTSNALNLLNAQTTNWEAFAPLASTKYFLTGTVATTAYMEILYRSAYA